ncbi:hypothetical protein GTW59_06320 [Streptomyces sp. SID89]|nr:hypothetical protein [Streptomyces sp. SID89]
MASTHLYKRRIGPWGLGARVTVDVRAVDESPCEACSVEGALVRWVPPRGLALADARWMAFGFGLVAGQLGAVGGGERAVLVRVDGWDVPVPTDYQEEVAAAAVIECLQQGFGIRGVDIGLSFDRERNRYGFIWDNAPGGPAATPAPAPAPAPARTGSVSPAQ